MTATSFKKFGWSFVLNRSSIFTRQVVTKLSRRLLAETATRAKRESFAMSIGMDQTQVGVIVGAMTKMSLP